MKDRTRVLVWQDHGQVRVLSGTLSAIVGKTLPALVYSYPKEDIDYVATYTSELDFERRVRSTTVDDECFEVFEFINITEV